MTNPQVQVGFLKFTHETAHARLTIWNDGVANVSGVYSRNRGRGYANAVLQQIIDYADEQVLVLTLEVQRYGYSDHLSPDNSQLIAFYSKFGFHVVPDGGTPTLMRRVPIL